MEATKMATTMKAVVQEGSGSEAAVTLRDWEVPELPDDRVLVKVRAASINAADYHSIHGGWLVEVVGKLIARGMKPYPVCGGDVAGVVAAVGKNVTTLRPGDEVFGNGRGTWAEYATAREGIVVTKPASLSFVEAAAAGVAATTALQGLRDKGGLRPGQRVLVYGAGGGVGTFAVQIAKALGAHVTAVTGPRSIDLVRPLGPDVLVDYTKEDVRARLERFDVIFDVAAIKSIGYLRSMLVPGGVLVLAGASKKGGWAGVFGRMIAGMLRARLLKQKVIFYVASLNAADTAYLRELLASGKIRSVIDRTYRLDEVREAVRYTMSGQGRAKVVLTVD
jgi:NADPH:quinone reductase-like Zn-dependent oxidoreductase